MLGPDSKYRAQSLTTEMADRACKHGILINRAHHACAFVVWPVCARMVRIRTRSEYASAQGNFTGILNVHFPKHKVNHKDITL
jgi:hypothetical protein